MFRRNKIGKICVGISIVLNILFFIDFINRILPTGNRAEKSEVKMVEENVIQVVDPAEEILPNREISYSFDAVF